MASVTLIYPPATEPRAPHLPLPALAAHLRGQGIATRLLDLDCDGLRALLRPEALVAAGARLARRGAAVEPRLRHAAERLPEVIGGALACFDERARFLAANDRLAAYHHLLDACAVQSAASPGGASWSIHPMHYDVAGIDGAKFADLVRVSAEPAANLFHDYWETEVLPAIDREAPTLVGISLACRQQTIPALMLARRLRARGHYVVLGGTFIARFVETLQGLPVFFGLFADAVVPYEGESALVELVTQLEGGRDLARVPNLLYRDGAQVRATRIHVENVATLPTPDFTGLPLDRYLTPDPVLPFLFGKGCYYDACRFCESAYINRVAKKRYRLRTVERVVEDVLTLADRHGARHFTVADEAAPPKLLAEFADRLLAVGREDLAFETYARFERGFTTPVLEKLARAGVKRFFFGLESYDQPSLDAMEKGTRLEDVAPLLDRCDAAGIRYHVFGLAGVPGQSRAAIERTMAFFREPRFATPGNGFDVQPMQIHLRSPYGRELDALPVEFDRTLLAREFVHGLGTAWTSTQGADRAAVTAALGDFQTALADPAWPAPFFFLWPMKESWSVYYAGTYDRTRFPWPVAMPEAAVWDGYTLRVADSTVTWTEAGRVQLASRHGGIALEAPAYETMRTLAGQTLADWVAAFGGAASGVATALAALVQRQILRLDPRR
ncbi:MAG: radical SAM protein [Gammaproteobacteria bacterium]|nr:radical SAM protein [Gammaproteobacteria bacterium]